MDTINDTKDVDPKQIKNILENTSNLIEKMIHDLNDPNTRDEF